MVKVEIDLPGEIYGFLEACAMFSTPASEKWPTEEERREMIDRYVTEYVTREVVISVQEQAKQIDTPLFETQILVDRYGLDEVDPNEG